MIDIGLSEIIILLIVFLPLALLIYVRVRPRRKQAARIAAIRSGDVVANMQFYPAGDQFICTECMNTWILQESPSHSFLAFLEIRCPSCSKKIHYPLLSSYRIIYYLILIITILIMLQKIIGGALIFLAIVSTYALFKDASIRKKIKAAIKLHNNNNEKIEFLAKSVGETII
jgi:small-conductance mechanosensitive channel